MATYREVVRRYWWFLPAAFLAERAGFAPVSEPTSVSRPPEVDRKARMAALLAGAAAGQSKNQLGGGMMAPYRNVVRMHLLIFFFAFAHAAKLDNFATYAVVYAVYFFPWRLVRRAEGSPVAA